MGSLILITLVLGSGSIVYDFFYIDGTMPQAGIDPQEQSHTKPSRLDGQVNYSNQIFHIKTVYSHLCLVVLYITNIVCLTPKTIWLANFLCILDLQLVIYTMPNVNLREGGGGSMTTIAHQGAASFERHQNFNDMV